MIARARTAKTSQKVNDMLSSMTGSTSMDAFERMKEKVCMYVGDYGCVCLWMGDGGGRNPLILPVVAAWFVSSSLAPPTHVRFHHIHAKQVEMLESKAEVAGQLAGTTDTSLEGKFKLLREGTAVDDELDRMKGLLGKGTAGFLPSGEVDRELEALRAEMERGQ